MCYWRNIGTCTIISSLSKVLMWILQYFFLLKKELEIKRHKYFDEFLLIFFFFNELVVNSYLTQTHPFRTCICFCLALRKLGILISDAQKADPILKLDNLALSIYLYQFWFLILFLKYMGKKGNKQTNTLRLH